MAPRRTAQRRAIQDVFERTDHPLSAAELLDVAKEQAPALGLATVYRAVKELLEEGIIVSVELPGGVTRYERAGKHHHHHFHCRACGRVFEAGSACLNATRMKVPKGFVVDSHEVVLYGRCAECAA